MWADNVDELGIFAHMPTDFRFALRLLAKSRGFSVVVIATLAVTIGLNSAIFSLIEGALLRPPVTADPGQVVSIFTGSRDAKREFRQFSHAEFTALRDPNAVFADVAAVNFNYVSVGRGRELRRAFAFMVSANYFELMGAHPAAGRFFTRDEARPNASVRVVVASYNLWQRHGRHPGFIGSTLLVNGQPHTVVGVSPEGFSGVSALIAPEVWLPLGLFGETTVAFSEAPKSQDLSDPANYSLNLMGRMRTGVTIHSAEAQLPTLAARLAAVDVAESRRPRDLILAKPFGIHTKPTDAGPLRLVGMMMLGMSAVVLLIGCLNLSNMMLARSSARASEIAVRLALGATRTQIVRQLLTEAVVLAVCGGAAGLLLSLWANTFLQNFFSAQFASFDLTLAAQLRPNLVVVAATFGLCLLATLLFSFGPALRAARADLVRDLKGQGGDVAVAGRWNQFFSGRHLLAMGQIALCLVMLFSAGLFLRTAIKETASTEAKGFTTDGVAVAQLDFSLARTPESEVMRRTFTAIERLRTLPGVQAAAATSLVPYNSSIATTRVAPAEAPLHNSANTSEAGTVGIYSSITAGYFETLGVKLLRGRDFSETEARMADANRVCIVDQGMAEKLFPGADALGRRVRFVDRKATAAAGDMEIVGIVSRHAHGMEDRTKPAPNIFVPLAQEFTPVLFLTVRSTAHGSVAWSQMLQTYRREMHALDPELPLLEVTTFIAFAQKNFTLRMIELGATIFAVFGAVALLLASLGVYGVKAYAVSRRTREIGIRMALGATSRDVFSLIMKQGVQQTAVALAAGTALSLAAGQALTAIFFELKPRDMIALSFAIAILTCASMLACFIPARRATRVSPLRALRTE